MTAMRRLASLGFLVVVLGCTDNSHPGALPNEVPNDAGDHFGAGQSATTTLSSSSGFGGFTGVGGATGTGGYNNCTCAAAYNDNSNGTCQSCWNTASTIQCATEYSNCFENVNAPTCSDVKTCIQTCGPDTTCQKTCFLTTANPDAPLFNAYLDCVCMVCESNCTEPLPLDCSPPPSTSASTGTGGFGP